jgi:3-oxoacyl-[acyl-carrier protein] reductase
MDTGLKGRVAMVSGASKGIGRAIAIALAAEGAQLSIAARTEALLSRLADDVRRSVPCLAHPADLTREDAIAGWVDATVERFGGIDILINNAGPSRAAPSSSCRIRRGSTASSSSSSATCAWPRL